ELPRMLGAGRNFAETDIFEDLFHAGGAVRSGSAEHLGCPPAGRNDTRADFHETEVRLRCRLHARPSHCYLASTTEGQRKWGGYYRFRVIPDSLGCPLEGPDHMIDFVPVALQGLHHQQHEIRARREVLALVPDHESL